MSDRPSNQWLYSESPTEKSPGPFLRRVPCSQDGMEPTGQRSQAWHSEFYRYIKIMFVSDKDHDFISQDSVTPFAKERFSYLYMEITYQSKHLDKIKILCRALLSRWSCEISMKTSSRQEKVWILPVTAMEYNNYPAIIRTVSLAELIYDLSFEMANWLGAAQMELRFVGRRLTPFYNCVCIKSMSRGMSEQNWT